MNMMRKAGIFLMIAALAAGCESPVESKFDPNRSLTGETVEGVNLSIEKTEFSPGERVVVLLTNGSEEAIGYNACSAGREVADGSGWRRIDPLRVCTAHLDVLERGKRVTFTEEVTAEWSPGDYRLVLQVHLLDSGESLTVHTPTFRVRP